MVKSGLENRFDGPNDVPRVSQYRLAAHLSTAFVLYTLMFWSALDHLIPAQSIEYTSKAALKAARKFRMLAHTCKGMVFLTAVSGKYIRNQFPSHNENGSLPIDNTEYFFLQEHS